jgi:hypothetical protein
MAQRAETPVETDDGRHDFDFFYGRWRQHNRKRADLLVRDDADWIEFESFSEAMPILGGLGNIDTYKAPCFPARPGFEGFSLRLFDPGTGLWRIWWASTIGQGQLDAPVAGRFRNGVGVFECDDVVQSVPVRVRFTWKGITERSAVWEQAFSLDGGESWDTNWITRHARLT